MNKVDILTFFFICSAFSLLAQEQKLTYKFSGFARGDFYYDDRIGISANEALFYLYPADVSKDVNGKDLNAVPHSGFYSFNTRLAVDISGLKVFNANLSAKAEADFAGFGLASALLRLRRAYLKMDWKKTSLLLGQDWTPMFYGAIPEVLSLSTGAPFNPFNRSPQIRFDYRMDKVSFAGAAIYQLQYNSLGPVDALTTSPVKSNIYQRNAILPELYLGVDYKNNAFKAGVSIDYLTLKPRTRSQVVESNYKVDESISSLSYAGYFGYTQEMFSVQAKTVYGQNLSNDCMLGGYGVSGRDIVTGEQTYTNFTHSSSWLNISYGKKYKGNLFAGYTKNLGTEKALMDKAAVYGEGLRMNELSRFCATFSYNIPRFTVGLEYEMNMARYGDGDMNWATGKYNQTHDVTSNRIVGVMVYFF